MDPLGPDPIIRSFERHLYAENRSSRTVMEWLRFRKSLGQAKGGGRRHRAAHAAPVVRTGLLDHGGARSP
jgi:hypothetical protein